MHHGRDPTVDDLEVLRRLLRARLDECWNRLEDAVAELIDVHEVPADEIISRIEATVGESELAR